MHCIRYLSVVILYKYRKSSNSSKIIQHDTCLYETPNPNIKVYAYDTTVIVLAWPTMFSKIIVIWVSKWVVAYFGSPYSKHRNRQNTWFIKWLTSHYLTTLKWTSITLSYVLRKNLNISSTPFQTDLFIPHLSNPQHIGVLLPLIGSNDEQSCVHRHPQRRLV